MYKYVMFFLLTCFTIGQGNAQNRTVDGTNNNLQNPTWGAKHAPLNQLTTLDYQDGISTPSGTTRPNPRIISNTLFAQDNDLFEPQQLSDYTWVFGQFIDHDIISVTNDATEPAAIPVDFADVHFNPGGAFPNIQINMFRSAAYPGTGTDVNNPRGYGNEITAWIDASGVYGSDETRANFLRSFDGGKLRISSDNLMPFNTDNGEYDGALDATAPHMDNENPFNDKLMVAGDARANENLLLASMHILFVREHNRLCEELIIAHPDWNDEQLYQHARKIVGGLIQSIVYEEWLPAMGVHLPPYAGYDTAVNPNIANVFSASAFRLGHTLLNSNIMRVDNQGNTIPEGNITLAHAFFNPHELISAGGVDPLFKGMATQASQDLDCKVVDDVRNFLFGPPTAGLGGLDLAAININRGRERGIPDYNTVREDFGLTPFASFEELNSDPAVSEAMLDLYGDINDVDSWVGMLAEEHMDDALFGEVIMAIMKQQFGAIRDGDRFYYENDEVLSSEEKADIKNTTLRDIIMRNTSVEVMQMNIFEAMPHESICPATEAEVEISGLVSKESGVLIEGVTVELLDLEDEMLLSTEITEEPGLYIFPEVETCQHYKVRASKNTNHGNGLSTFDIVLITRHILNTELLDSPYKILAADVNNSGTITAFDLVDMRKVILTLQDTFSMSPSWRFFNGAVAFPDPGNPFSIDQEDLTEINYLSDNTLLNFVAVKVGDVNYDANPALLLEEAEVRATPTEALTLTTEDRMLEAGKTYSVALRAEGFDQIAGMQFTLDYDEESLEVVEILSGNLTQLGEQNYRIKQEEGMVLLSWNDELERSAEGIVMTLQVEAKTTTLLSEVLTISSREMQAEAYSKALDLLDVTLRYDDLEAIQKTAFVLNQNRPNPFTGQTVISFTLPEAGMAELMIFDAAGRPVKNISGQYNAGFNAVRIDQQELGNTGVFYYQLNTTQGSQTQKMILLQAARP